MKLTPREREIAEHLARGKNAPTIAAELGISYHTVATHIRQAARALPGDEPAQEKLVKHYLSYEEAPD